MLHDDIEAYFTIDDEDDDYNHIPPTPIESDDDDDDGDTKRHDFALAARTSDIISSYRDFLANMDEEANNDDTTTTSSTLSSTYDLEQVSAKNIQLTNEMASIRASLGRDIQKNIKKKKRSSLGSRANIHIYEESCLQSDLHNESNSTKYSHPLLHSNVIKKRLLSAATIIFVVGVGVMLVTTEISKHSNDSRQDNFNLPDWNEESKDVHLEEVEKQKGTSLNVNQLASSKWHARVSGSVKTNTKEESEAMQMIEEIIHHPEDVHIVEPLRGSKQGKSATSPDETSNKSSTVKKSSTKSSKISASKSNKTLGKSNKESSTTKSGKASSSQSKSAKSNSSDESHIQVAPVQDRIEPRSNDPAVVATTTSSTLASFSILDFPSEKSNRNSELPTAQEEVDTLEEAKDIVKRERLHLESAHILYQTISRKYNPIFYSRSKGEYGGHSFTDVMSFCQENYPKSGDGKVGVPCGYQVYCPEGPNTVPYGGYVTNEINSTGDGGAYAPIISFEENWIGWVQLSEGHSCNEYPVLEPEPTIEQTGHIMCCKDVN